MKKEDLVAKGLSEEHAQIAVDSYNETIKGFIPKTRFDEVNEQLKTANTTIDTLKKDNKDNEQLQQEVTTYKSKVTELETAAANTQKEYALKDKLREAGVLDADYIIYKQGGVEKFNFDKEGKPIGVDDVVKPFKEVSPHLFKKEPGAEYNPAGGGNPPAKNPFAKESFNLTEQGKLLRDNPEQAKQLAAAAGTTI
ncbi:MAG: phage scaffolding protein [Lachnospiraceae bacterium]